MARRKEKPWIVYANAPAHKEYALATFKYNCKHLIVSLAAAPNSAPDGARASAPLETNPSIIWLDQERGLARAGGKSHSPSRGPPIRAEGPLGKDSPQGLERPGSGLAPQGPFPSPDHDGTAKIFEITPDQAVCAPEREILPGPDASFTPDPRFPMHSAGNIQVLKVFDSGNGPACQARLDHGQVVMSKTPPNGLKSDDIKRVMRMLVAIHDAEARLSISVATPHLLGYVTHAEDPDLVVGFLREWVPSSSRLGATLECVPLAKTDVDKRQEWADQIKETMDDLHDMGLFWGDCKAANVIVDEEENTWLIDLGGQFTQNWVERGLRAHWREMSKGM